jgi:hypothetical protein
MEVLGKTDTADPEFVSFILQAWQAPASDIRWQAFNQPLPAVRRDHL